MAIGTVIGMLEHGQLAFAAATGSKGGAGGPGDNQGG
jgi:hypothetical protein